MKNKNKAIMIILSLLMPGLGNLYIGDKKKGSILLAVSLITTAVSDKYKIITGLFIIYYIYAILTCLSTYNNQLES
ncbi:hypothetical protein KQI36_15815 [Clostridium senegalense]|uniref:hypothetical protein n=1 Tax=Clostridium senegalense TaxID=1465809 RepID=UPI001C123D9E|nr:hypothetical protein [Clostridium senegalense]MBU5228099.1 hypothetical protein [Clostridium senegalense]